MIVKTERKIAKDFVKHISKRLKRDLMYSIKKSKNPYVKGESDIDLFIVPVENNFGVYYYMWMLVEGILKFGTCNHKNKRTGKYSTKPLIDVLILFNKEAEKNCRKAMLDSGNFEIVRYYKNGNKSN